MRPVRCRHCGADALEDNGCVKPNEVEWRCMECGEYAPTCPGCGLPHEDEELTSDDRCDSCGETCPDCGSSVEERDGGWHNCFCADGDMKRRAHEYVPLDAEVRRRLRRL